MEKKDSLKDYLDFYIQEKPNPHVGIFGYGITGRALMGIYRDSPYGYPVVNDYKRKSNFDYSVAMDALNICTPYDEDFVDIVIDEIKKTKAKLTIIYSTVPPYTTQQIRSAVNKPVVFSPVMGQRDMMHKSIYLIRRFIGADNSLDVTAAKDHINLMGFKRKIPRIVMPAATLEFDKIVGNVYFGVCLAYTDYISKLYKEYGLPFDSHILFNEVFNKGCRTLRNRRFLRPSLVPPSPSGLEGGTIIPYAKILQAYMDSKLLQSVIELKETKMELNKRKQKLESYKIKRARGKNISIQ